MKIETPGILVKEYENRLRFRSWNQVSPLIHDQAVFIFSDGTFRGKEAIRRAFERTFNLIKDETYTISGLNWIHETGDLAVCDYTFAWNGIIAGKSASGTGRGSCTMVRTRLGWQLLLEHLGPPAA